MIIKVCGMRDPDNIREVAKTGPDWMGMIFYNKSPRFVATPKAALSIPHGIKRVGVFVDAMPQTIITMVETCNLDIVQLHGNESPTLIRNLRSSIDRELKFMKVISVVGTSDLEKCEGYEDCADYFLFDTKCKERGGSGRQFDWSVIERYNGNLPFILSGGIGPEDAERVLALRHPKLMGIDLNSRFETAPAVKDAEALSRFIKQLI